jgi:hypothetical protein
LSKKLSSDTRCEEHIAKYVRAIGMKGASPGEIAAACHPPVSRSTINRCFKSIMRGSVIPAEVRVSGFNLETVADELMTYVVKEAPPNSPVARAIWGGS